MPELASLGAIHRGQRQPPALGMPRFVAEFMQRLAGQTGRQRRIAPARFDFVDELADKEHHGLPLIAARWRAANQRASAPRCRSAAGDSPCRARNRPDDSLRAPGAGLGRHSAHLRPRRRRCRRSRTRHGSVRALLGCAREARCRTRRRWGRAQPDARLRP